MKRKIKQIFLTGLAVTIPIGVTFYILFFLITLMDSLLLIIPPKYHPDTWLHFHIPGLGIIVTIVFIFVCGLATKSYLGNRIVGTWERMVRKIPVFRSIYNASKQVADRMFRNMSSGFKKVVLIEFPRKGTYTVGFVTGKANGELQQKTSQDLVSVFVPTTPNPTSGYLVMMTEDQMIPLDMSVEEAFTLIISGGIVSPSGRPEGSGASVLEKK